MTSSPRSIDAFGPEILSALTHGAREEIKLPLSYRNAVYFRSRLHQLRAVMRETKHPLASLVVKTRISIDWDTDKHQTLYTRRKAPYPVDRNIPVTLTIRPHDSDFTSVLKAAGVDVDKAEDIEITSSSPSSDPLEAFFETKE